ncbi:hypothetical protein PFISCL1PPCAC_4355, partial [Pristionchus fissidentatus]
EMLDIVVVLVLGAAWLLRWARKNGLFSPLLGSRLSGSVCEEIDGDLGDETVPYPGKVPGSIGILYTDSGLCSQQTSSLVAFLLHCSRAGVRKVREREINIVIHGHSNADELKASIESILADYGQDRI